MKCDPGFPAATAAAAQIWASLCLSHPHNGVYMQERLWRLLPFFLTLISATVLFFSASTFPFWCEPSFSLLTLPSHDCYSLLSGSDSSCWKSLVATDWICSSHLSQPWQEIKTTTFGVSFFSRRRGTRLTPSFHQYSSSIRVYLKKVLSRVLFVKESDILCIDFEEHLNKRKESSVFCRKVSSEGESPSRFEVKMFQ